MSRFPTTTRPKASRPRSASSPPGRRNAKRAMSLPRRWSRFQGARRAARQDHASRYARYSSSPCRTAARRSAGRSTSADAILKLAGAENIAAGDAGYKPLVDEAPSSWRPTPSSPCATRRARCLERHRERQGHSRPARPVQHKRVDRHGRPVSLGFRAALRPAARESDDGALPEHRAVASGTKRE